MSKPSKLEQEQEEVDKRVKRESRENGKRRRKKRECLEWQGESDAASITVKDGSRLHLRLPGNYRLDREWRGPKNSTLNFTFTTRPYPPPPATTTQCSREEKGTATSSKILICVLICVFLCLLLIPSLILSHSGFKQPDRTRDSDFTREQLRERLRTGP